MNLVEIEYTIRYGLQVIKHITAVNPVSVTKVHVEGPHFLGQIIKFGIDRPIKLLARKVVTQLRHHTQQPVVLKKPVVLKRLPVRKPVTSTVTQ